MLSVKLLTSEKGAFFHAVVLMTFTGAAKLKLLVRNWVVLGSFLKALYLTGGLP